MVGRERKPPCIPLTASTGGKQTLLSRRESGTSLCHTFFFFLLLLLAVLLPSQLSTAGGMAGTGWQTWDCTTVLGANRGFLVWGTEAKDHVSHIYKSRLQWKGGKFSTKLKALQEEANILLFRVVHMSL